MPIFIAVGLVFPAVLTMITFASNRALGPVVTGALGNLSPLLSVAVAVLLLHEPLRLLQFAGLMVAVLGVLAITVTRTDDMRDWRTWALLLPLGASVMRGFIPPIIKVGLEIWPSPIAAGLTGYMVSTLTVLTVERIRTGRFVVRAPLAGKLWFALNGICNGIGTLLLYAALGAGPVSLVAPLYATYPLFTVGLSVLFLGNVRITWRLVAGTALTVGGVVLVSDWLKPAEPVVALVLPVAAGVVVLHVHRGDVLRVLEAELGRHAALHREAVLARQDLVVELEA